MSINNQKRDHNSLSQLFRTPAKSKTYQKLHEAGYFSIQDLLWILPLRIQKSPKLRPFSEIDDDGFFMGSGQVLNRNFRPVFRARGKRGAPLFQGTLIVQDKNGPLTIQLKWFNIYPNMMNKLNALEEVTFLGEVSAFKGSFQIVNPKIIEDNASQSSNEFLIEYPTINTISGTQVKKLINKIPESHWQEIEDTLPKDVLKKREHISLGDAFNIIHGKVSPHSWSKEKFNKAKSRLIYEEFFQDQIKVMVRKKILHSKPGEKIQIHHKDFQAISSSFPYTLTLDQQKAITAIREDLSSGHRMLRMLQGDVGSGKTTVALISAALTLKAGLQVAFMCPTEALANQHFQTVHELNEIFASHAVALLTGSMSKKEKSAVYQKIKDGELSFIIGTHALFQDDVEFNRLRLCIIDEQHKFGVKQREKLISKGKDPHCLLMTATPIPRTLRLTQYGDMEISLIKSLPAGRKGIQTRIVSTDIYPKYLSFLKTRVALGEQVYIVVPAIEDNPSMDLKNVEQIQEFYKKTFPNLKIAILHGQLSSEEKQKTMNQYNNGIIEILISTSVIEVGINNINSTVMSIYDAERFGLSSLHQLRGRVGRGDKPGFCFLIPSNTISNLGIERLKVIESSTDGFHIAEEDLRLRGHGDLFGKEQSGRILTKKVAHIINDHQVLELAIKDLKDQYANDPSFLNKYTEKYKSDHFVSSTV